MFLSYFTVICDLLLLIVIYDKLNNSLILIESYLLILIQIVCKSFKKKIYIHVDYLSRFTVITRKKLTLLTSLISSGVLFHKNLALQLKNSKNKNSFNMIETEAFLSACCVYLTWREYISYKLRVIGVTSTNTE